MCGESNLFSNYFTFIIKNEKEREKEPMERDSRVSEFKEGIGPAKVLGMTSNRSYLCAAL